jgi:hypothetical protein
MTFAELRVDIVVLCCAISAGVHAALVPAHFEEGAGPGLGFIAAAAAPALCALVLTRSPSRTALLATAAVLGGLIVSYLLVIAHGLPVLHPEQEPVEPLAVWTKAIEGAGLVVAAGCVARVARPVPLPLTLLVAAFSALVALAVSGGMDMTHDHAHDISVHVTHVKD